VSNRQKAGSGSVILSNDKKIKGQRQMSLGLVGRNSKKSKFTTIGEGIIHGHKPSFCSIYHHPILSKRSESR